MSRTLPHGQTCWSRTESGRAPAAACPLIRKAPTPLRTLTRRFLHAADPDTAEDPQAAASDRGLATAARTSWRRWTRLVPEGLGTVDVQKAMDDGFAVVGNGPPHVPRRRKEGEWCDPGVRAGGASRSHLSNRQKAKPGGGRFHGRPARRSQASPREWPGARLPDRWTPPFSDRRPTTRIFVRGSSAARRPSSGLPVRGSSPCSRASWAAKAKAWGTVLSERRPVRPVGDQHRAGETLR